MKAVKKKTKFKEFKDKSLHKFEEKEKYKRIRKDKKYGS